MSVYARILRHPRMAGLFAAALVARLPIGINGLAVVLFLREQTGSFAVPGAVAGGLALGMGVGAPFMGRLVDRLGARVLVPLAVGKCGRHPGRARARVRRRAGRGAGRGRGRDGRACTRPARRCCGRGSRSC